jgi:hypothetical protein
MLSVVWPSHLRLAQNYYDLEKINVECTLTTVKPKIITTSKKYNDFKKINVECGLALSPPSRPELLRPRKNKC